MKKESVRRAQAREHIKGRAAQAGAAAAVAGIGTVVGAQALAANEAIDDADIVDVTDVVVESRPQAPAHSAPAAPSANEPQAAAQAAASAQTSAISAQAGDGHHSDASEPTAVANSPAGAPESADYVAVDAIDLDDDEAIEVVDYATEPDYDGAMPDGPSATFVSAEDEDYVEVFPEAGGFESPAVALSVSEGALTYAEPDFDPNSIASLDLTQSETEGLDPYGASDDAAFGDIDINIGDL